ncbi:hypothetical protein K4B79_27000 [Streptomyces lincolnensis]|uniref:hypothetical protein n=1 Tax=Streptomyces lincolnensis TaxID=1915 RepID=UPI001E2A3CB2|nr:hypothetical protein [Streptomyces lincolnensis]MCD7441860.1 hypothetical protein [Streptomyces lincolnensis]
MTLDPDASASPGGSLQAERWQRAVTRWAAVLGGASLVLLVGLVLSMGDADLAGNLVNAVVAGANMAFVIFTWAVFKAGQEQLAQMRSEARAQSEAWRHEYRNALATYEEAVRARLDQSAPRVSVTFDTWTAHLVNGGRTTVIQPGTAIPEGAPEFAVRLATRWVVKNWGTEPVVVHYPVAPSTTEDIRIAPSGEHTFPHEEERTADEWRTAQGRWRHSIEVRAEDLGGGVLDSHTWTREIPAFRLDQVSRLTLQDLDIVRGSVAKRSRTYRGPAAASP